MFVKILLINSDLRQFYITSKKNFMTNVHFKLKNLCMPTLFLLFILTSCEKKIDMNKYKLKPNDIAKLDMASFPEARAEILKMLYENMPDKAEPKKPAANCSDDMVAVGPEGLRSIGYEQWEGGFKENDIKFKKVDVVQGSEIIRIYNEGKTAVLNWAAHVTFETPVGDISVNVCRLETYIKKGDTWCLVAGQGTIPSDFDDVTKTLVLRLLLSFLIGLFLMYLLMKWRTKSVIA